MATRVVDPNKALALIRKYRPETIAKSGTDGILLYEFLCPFHNDTHPSFQYRASIDFGFCQACSGRGGLVALINAFEHTDSGKTIVENEGCFVTVTRGTASAKKAHSIDVSDAQITLWQAELEQDTKLQVLFRKWGWSKEKIQYFKLGASEGRLTFPMYERESLVNVKFYSPGAKEHKYENKAGSYVGIWPFENLNHKEVYIVEGEKDCMTMISHGFNAVTFTGGARTIPKVLLPLFIGKIVNIIYDIDEAGHKGSADLGQALSRITKQTFIIDLPATDMPAKGDITDLYVLDPVNFVTRIKHYKANSTEFRGKEAISRVAVPAEVVPTYLESVVKNKLFYRRVGMKVRVVNNAKDQVSLLPKDAVLSCNKDYKAAICATCPLLFESNGIAISMKPDFPEMLSMIGNNAQKVREALRSLCELAPGCPKFNIEFKQFQAMYPIVIIPSIEADKTSHDYSLVGAWALDVPAKENDDYAVEATVLANPESQKLEIICYSMVKDEASLDEFELTATDIQSLKVFQCANQP